MLDVETKRRIDTARDILVGKVPDPKSQVEQITIALIYKFMDDMDAGSEELGGHRNFFTGDFERYGWSKLMRSGLGGYEALNLYAEAIVKMQENPGIPPLFRDIFKNAYLPYRDPETLRSFLKIIDEFEYDHSERLGDAFEYLLSVLGSQGDAGQFRTPRHIIDFIVAIIDPKKDETILDPACGTAGFLISSYKHILKANTDDNGASTLTPDERVRLAQNLKGYDISPDMVRLSLVNLYLHGFTDPHIYEYDTLTSQDRWNEHADVILANPPFMSPKGGIKPHNRFSVKSKRSEVLFVDYIAEHLTANGRVGVIVPEGIIFQVQSAYRNLRRMLVEDYLVAVISLPAGVFNPYADVKTSILILDKVLAKQNRTIGFFKVSNDGFSLGAQRRPIDRNDIPQVEMEIREYLDCARMGIQIASSKSKLGLIVDKEKVADTEIYNLSWDRYRENSIRVSAYPMVRLGDIIDLEFGTRITKKNDEGTLYPVYGGGGESFKTNTYSREDDAVISRFAMSRECVRLVKGKFFLLDSGFTFDIKEEFTDRASKAFITRALLGIQDDIYACGRGHAQKNIDVNAFRNIGVPLPSLEVQAEIVAEIEGYQRVIDAACAVIDNYRPYMPVRLDWPIVELGEISSFKNGLNFTRSSSTFTFRIVGVGDFQNNLYAPLEHLSEVHVDRTLPENYLLKEGDILFVRSNGNPNLVGRSIIVPTLTEPTTFSGFTIRARMVNDRALPIFYARYFKSRDFAEMIKTVGQGANIRNLSQGILKKLRVPLPPLNVQHEVVAEIEAEQALVSTNRELIEHFEKKIDATFSRVWADNQLELAEA